MRYSRINVNISGLRKKRMPETTLPKTYDFSQHRAAPLPDVGREGYFKPSNDPNQPGFDPTKKPFVISIPPPNVTGSCTWARHVRVDGRPDDPLPPHERQPTLWVPGTDHAGIATQLQVEKMLAKEGTSREEWGARSSCAAPGNGKRSTAASSPADPPPGRFLRLGARALHAG
jgi:hypothetical protein